MIAMNILLVEDEQDSRTLVAGFLKEIGHHVVEMENGFKALEAFSAQEFHMVLTDIRMPVMTGLELLRKLRGLPEGQNADIILYTGFGDVETAVEALRSGAYDYLIKPINVEELVKVTERVAEHQALKRENEVLTRKFEDAVEAATEEARQELMRLKKAYSQVLGIGGIGIFSKAMKKAVRVAKQLHADRSIPVFIEGDTGTGKEVIARLTHFGTGDETAPFVDLNCAAIAPNMFESELFGYEAGAFTGGLPKGSKGKLDLAQGGTLFLDEITEMPVSLQAKLLRVIQEKEFYRVGGLKKIKTDVRIICATNDDIEARVAEGTFRRDLYFRLNVGNIHIPPLRERPEDIIPLAQLFLTTFAQAKRKRFSEISQEAADMLLSHNWPGNVRELKNAMEWVVLMWDEKVLKPTHLGILREHKASVSSGASIPGVIDSHDFTLPSGGLPIDDYTNNIIRKALQLHGGNKTETAKYLGISRRSLHCRLKHFQQ